MIKTPDPHYWQDQGYRHTPPIIGNSMFVWHNRNIILYFAPDVKKFFLFSIWYLKYIFFYLYKHPVVMLPWE